MGEIPPQDIARLKVEGRFDVMQVATPGTPLVFFMNTERPPTDDLVVRQAILYALDRAAIVRTVFMGTSPVAEGPLSASTQGYSSDVKGLYPYDPGRAADLLDQAGWIDEDGDGIREKDGRSLTLEAYLMNWGYIPEVAQIMQEQLRAVGIDMRATNVTYPAALEAGRRGRHNLIPFSLSGSDPDILRTFFASENADAGFNWAKVRDTRLDELLVEGLGTREAAKRKAVYAQVQQRVMGQALIIPIRDQINLNGMSVQVRGLRFDSGGWFPWLYDVQLSD
jgi:peptide/nickel transport system substrate-binding protein